MEREENFEDINQLIQEEIDKEKENIKKIEEAKKNGKLKRIR